MQQITLTEAAANLQEYGRMCHHERIVVVSEGQPAFQLVPVDDDDNFMNDLIQNNAEFRGAMLNRKSGKTMSAQEALRRLS